MAEALINHDLADQWQAFSAGVEPAGQVSRRAIEVLKELGLDTSQLRSKSVDEFLDRNDLDLVVTVCDNAKESCPIFPRPVKQIHVAFVDPHQYENKPGEIALPKYRETRDKIRAELLPKLKEMS